MIQGNRFYGVILGLLLLLGGAVKGQEVKDGLEWYTDITKACDVANKTGKPIFAFFTGSDWCGWCHKLEHDVLSKPSFKAWAKKNVILLELDFPHNKKQPDELVKQNNSLQQFFKVQGYPTCWIFDMTKQSTTGQYNILPYGSLGYPRATAGSEADAFLKTANEILAKKTTNAPPTKPQATTKQTKK